MTHIKEVDISIKVDIRQDQGLADQGRASFDWAVQGGSDESDRFFDTASEAEVDALDRLDGALS